MKNIITKFTKWLLTESMNCHQPACHGIRDEFSDTITASHCGSSTSTGGGAAHCGGSISTGCH